MSDEGRMQRVTPEGDALTPLVATFMCDRCGDVASTLTLLPPHAPDPLLSAAGVPAGDVPFSDLFRLNIEGPIDGTHTLLPGLGVDVEALERALDAQDADRIYALDREFAPARCRPCAKNYCRTCWLIWIEDDEGFYDCTRGRCPEGHERIMDD